MWQTVITAAGNDDEIFRSAGFQSPKNWVNFQGKFIIQKAIESYSAPNSICQVVLKASEKSHWDENSGNFQNRVKGTFLQNQTSGALCTALLGLEGLDLSQPLIVAPADSFIVNGIETLVEKFLKTTAVAGTFLFESDDEKYSYARLNQGTRVVEMAEKRRISKYASTGVFIFRSGRHFLDAGAWVLEKNMQSFGEFFMSSSLNYLVMLGEEVEGQTLLSPSHYVRLATPFDLNRQLREM